MRGREQHGALERRIHVGPLEQAEPELHAQHAAHRLVDHRLRAAARRFTQGGAVRGVQAAHHLHVHARRERLRGGLGPVGGDAVIEQLPTDS